MNTPYIYQAKLNSQHSESNRAIIMIPDVFGQTNYAKATADGFASQLDRPVFMLDYFYQLTNKSTIISPENHDEIFPLMEKMRGEDFVAIFDKAIAEICQENPQLKHFTMIGFCFGGRLTYLAGRDVKVDHLASFYGAGAHNDFYAGQTSIAALIEARHGDKNLHVLSFYGTQDESIPLEDRVATKTELEQAGISYEAREYDTGHAYFQEGRPSYDADAAAKSWTELKNFLQ